MLECWKWHIRASRFQNVLGEHAPTSPYNRGGTATYFSRDSHLLQNILKPLHLQAVDVRRKRRLYFDPLHSKETKMNDNDRLWALIDNISAHILHRGSTFQISSHVTISGFKNCCPRTFYTFLILFCIRSCSQLIDLMIRRKCTECPCVEPLHYHQKHGYNCGVIIFFGNFLRKLQKDLTNIKI